MIIELFIIGTVIHMAFVFWYRNTKGKLKPNEIEAVMEKFVGTHASQTTKPEDLRKFMEEDDGKEFYMMNYVDLKSSDNPSGVENVEEARKNLQTYFKNFTRALFKRGGHPVYMMSRVGGNVDTWGNKEDIDYQIMAMMRYRSRRDLVELLSSNNMPEMHKFKLAAIERTVSFPAHMQLTFFMKPFYWVPLIILLTISLLSIGINTYF